MMFHTYNFDSPPDKLMAYVDSGAGLETARFRRRAVLTRRDIDGDWSLVSCTVEGAPCDGQPPQGVPSRYYENTVLYEDWLSAEQCRQFIDHVQTGRATFGDVALEHKGNPQWDIELVPLENSYMPRAGQVVQVRFSTKVDRYSHGPLLAQDAPYYPDLAEATRDWLPLTTYHGDSDGRNERIIFLMPEFRTFFADAGLENGVLKLVVGGTEIVRTRLFIKGAYWVGKKITHFEGSVTRGQAEFHVPDEAERLEYVLLGADGEVRDYQREDKYNHTGLGRNRLSSSDQGMAEFVKRACLDGEGPQAEFKPFIDCDQGIGSKDKKTKLRELVTTVVAFANTKGGRIYLGISDQCALSGIDQGLCRWASGSDDMIDRYRGTLTAKIRDHVIGDVTMRISHTFVDTALFMIVNVSQAAKKPVTVKDDNSFYVRVGANNRQLPPDQWESVLLPQNADGLRY